MQTKTHHPRERCGIENSTASVMRSLYISIDYYEGFLGETLRSPVVHRRQDVLSHEQNASKDGNWRPLPRNYFT